MAWVYVKKLAFVLIILAVLAGCGKKEVVKPTEENVKATKALAALQAMETAYKARDYAGVMKYVSPDLENGYSEFQTSLRKDIDLYGKVDLSIDIDRVEVLEDGSTRAVFNWYGKWYDTQDAEHEGRGNSVFSFKESDSQMVLAGVTGDSPFGVVR